MLNSLLAFTFFRKNSHYAALFIRIAFGIHLIYFTQDNVFSYTRMLEFRDFLAVRGVPFPLIGATVSVAVQFSCGLLLILGAYVRVAAIFLFINFVSAIIIAHIGQPYEQFYPAAQMIAIALFFLFNGAGAFSVDQILENRMHQKKSTYTLK